MTTTNTTPDVPPPAGAIDVYDWDDDGRLFIGRRWVISGAGSRWHPDDIEVCIDGTQYRNGELDRQLVAGNLHQDDPITTTQARELGRALIAAADEQDRLAEQDRDAAR